MSSTPPDAPGSGQQGEAAPIPVGYQPGDYVPFADRDPSNPSSIAGQWADPARQAQMGGGRPMTEEERYRAIYGYDAPVRVVFASWGRRVLGYVVDMLVSVVAGIPAIAGLLMVGAGMEWKHDASGNEVLNENTTNVSGAAMAFYYLGLAILIAFNVYNHVIRQGRTGYSFGKTAVGIRLVDRETGRPLGAARCFLRQLAHIVDSLICYLGWLWPLWDPQRQTLADKIVGSVVVIQSPDSAQ